MKVEIYSDITCPWCYVGEHRFLRALAAFPQSDQVEVVFRPYQLDPTLPQEPQPLTEQLQKKFGPRLDATLRQTAATAKQDGLDLRFDKALSVNTLTAHRLLHLALVEAGPDAQRALAEQLFEMHFTNGENVADHALLTDRAVAVGLDRDRVEAYLASDEGLQEVQDEIAHAQRLGIRAVPTFVFDERTAVQGAQPTSVFLQALKEIYLGSQIHQESQIQEEASATDEASTEACVDGSCTV